MAKYPIEKYTIVVHQHPTYHTTEIIAFSTYAGKVVKGNAICQSGDTYDEQAGIRLAVARCAEKIARKRQARADRLVTKAAGQVYEAQKYLANMTAYAADARDEVKECQAELKAILDKM